MVWFCVCERTWQELLKPHVLFQPLKSGLLVKCQAVGCSGEEVPPDLQAAKLNGNLVVKRLEILTQVVLFDLEKSKG